MVGESDTTQAAPPRPCPNCGAIGQGRFCSACGASLSQKPVNPYWLFVDSYFKVGELRRYAGLYWYIVRSPTRATLELFETGTLHDALRFLEYSVGLLILLFFSQLIVVPGSDLLTGLVTHAYFVVAQSVGLLLHYSWAALWVKPRRAFADFLRLAGFFYGFTLPISGALQGVSLAHRTLGSVLFIVLSVPLLIYAIRVWRRYWGLPGWVVFLLLFGSSLVGALVGMLFLVVLVFVVGLLLGPRA